MSFPEAIDVPCPACGSTSEKHYLTGLGFDVKSDKDTTFGRVYACPDCRLGRVWPMPSSDEISAHYELGSYYTHGVSHFWDVKPRLADKILTKLAFWNDAGADPVDLLSEWQDRRQTELGRALRVIDIGCGNGSLMGVLRMRGAKVTGIDPDPGACDEARGKGFEVHAGTAEALPVAVEGETFDLVAMTHVLEHTVDPHRALENVRGLLAPEGRLFCEVPNSDSLHFERFHQVSEMLDVPRHLFFYSKSSLSELCSRSGFKIEAWHFRGLTRHHSAPWRSWEAGIHDRAVSRGENVAVPRHNLLESLRLLMAEFRAPEERKYDCIGFFATAT